MSERGGLSMIEFEMLLFVSVAPREQISVRHVLPVMNRLLAANLVSCQQMYPDMPDENVWMITAPGLNLVRSWQNDDNNRHRQYGASSVLPK